MLRRLLALSLLVLSIGLLAACAVVPRETTWITADIGDVPAAALPPAADRPGG